jgi:benzoyl-CoA 2,3-dioxygenase component B
VNLPATSASRARSSNGSQFISWWKDMGPYGFRPTTTFAPAISVESDGWANFDTLKMPDYRWGIFPPIRQGSHHRLRKRLW